MIDAIELENFKGVAARQRVDFAPLTLLFGSNSAGKSTILQALLYLHELLAHGSADVDHTEIGGRVIELGGFARLVNRHQTDRAIVLRVEFTTPGRLELFGRELSDFPFPDLDDEVESAWLELTVLDRTTPTFSGPLIDRVTVGIGQAVEPLVELRTGETLRDGEPLRVGINLAHPFLSAELEMTDELGHPLTNGARDAVDEWEQIALPNDTLQLLANKARDGNDKGSFDRWSGWDIGDGRSWVVFAVSGSRPSALPPLGQPLRVITLNEGDDVTEESRLKDRIRSQGYTDALQGALDKRRARERAAIQVRTFLEMIVLGTTAQLAESLRDAIYIGPLRTVPPRGFLYERRNRITSWADGLAAWDRLLGDRANLVEQTNEWLARVGAGCKVVVQELFNRSATAEDLSRSHVDETVRRLLLDTGAGSLVLPSEVGAGVSQVIPVIVAALEGRAGLVLVEQPEIHIHPAVQVGLGDLFIDAATRDSGRRTMVVETHSEHLILRLLRRIRETTESELENGAPSFSPDKLSVLYVEGHSDGVRIRRLRVDDQGEFQDRWPKGFFAERMEELL